MHPFGSELTPVYYHSLFLSSQRDILLKVWRMHRAERGRRERRNKIRVVVIVVVSVGATSHQT